ncbi:unnamed protein product, partial [Allacma fusca]
EELRLKSLISLEGQAWTHAIMSHPIWDRILLKLLFYVRKFWDWNMLYQQIIEKGITDGKTGGGT